MCVWEYFCKLKTKSIASLSYVWVCVFAATLYVLVLFALSLVNYYDSFLYFFAWFLNDAYSVVILVLFHLLRVLEIIFHFLSVHIRIYYKYPVEAKKRENLPFFFLLACHFWANLLELCVWVLFPFLYRHLLGDYLFFYHSSFCSVKIRKQDGFVSVWFRLFAYILCFFFMSVWVMYQKVEKRKIKIQFVVTLSSIWNRN